MPITRNFVKKKIGLKVIDSCRIGGRGEFEEIWSLPNLPLTEMYGDYDPDFPNFDQSLVIDTESGHVQLQNQISPEFLYNASEYNYRSTLTAKGQRDEKLFLEFLKRHIDLSSCKCAVELGGNDLSFARKLANEVKKVVVIDPICEVMDGETIDKIDVIGRFVEHVDIRCEIGDVDLVVARHTLEHIASPIEIIEQLFSQCHQDCLFVFEVPSLKCLCDRYRFDAVFHQHYHYFDEWSFRRLVDAAGGNFLGSFENHLGSCGGSLIVAFQSGKSASETVRLDSDINRRIEVIRNAISIYDEQMKLLSGFLDRIDEPIYGFGASLMISTLEYQLDFDFSKLVGILDDDVSKHGVGYRNVKVTVSHPSRLELPSCPNILITSLESVRPISKRVLDFSPVRVLSPLVY